MYLLLLEFYPKGLRAGGVSPLALLKLLTIELGYHCFNTYVGSDNVRGGMERLHLAPSLEDFAAKYVAPLKRSAFGRFTDLLCIHERLVDGRV